MEDCLQFSWLRLLQSSPALRGHHESRCPLGRSAVDTSWPHTREVSLGPKAEQDRQKPSNWCLVNVRLQFTTQCLPRPRHCGLSGRDSFTFVQRDVAPLPLGQLFCVSVTKLTWPPLLWSSQGVDFTNHSLFSEGRSRGPTSSTVLRRAILQEDLLLQLQWPSGMPSLPRGSTTSRYP